MRVVIIGPGRIGCGYLAPLFSEAGWEVVLAARDAATAERIRRTGRFLVRVTGTGREHAICGIHAVAVGTPAFEVEVADVDLVCTAVGVGNVPALGPPLARALAWRREDRPLDVWCVENHAVAPALEAAVWAVARSARLELPNTGIAGAIATVAVSHGDWGGPGVPTFIGDADRRLLVDGRRTLTGMPPLPGVRLTASYEARLREKLYVFNAGHAVAAYLGWLLGHATVARAVADPFLRPMLVGCLLESRRALLAAYPRLGNDLRGPVAAALSRYADKDLADPVPRVARDPIRKLGQMDRLLGPAALIRETTGRVPAYFALAIAAALLYRHPDDVQAGLLGRHLRRHGVAHVLADVCGLQPGDPLGAAVARRYHGFILTPDGVLFPPVHDGSSSQAGLVG
ncbi:MAG: 2-dehydropantoate 2-reductase N-terminal domain-containing protein [Nitriliruptorales bacterium]